MYRNKNKSVKTILVFTINHPCVRTTRSFATQATLKERTLKPSFLWFIAGNGYSTAEYCAPEEFRNMEYDYSEAKINTTVLFLLLLCGVYLYMIDSALS